MPFFSDTDPGFRSDIATAPPPPRPAPTGPEAVAAAFRQNNSVVSVYNSIANAGDFTPDPNYNPLDTIKGTTYEQQHLGSFAGSRSEAETRSIMRTIDGEEKDRQTIEAAGVGGAIVSMAAGAADPTMFLPGGVAVKAGRAGYEFVPAAKAIGAAALVQTTAQEALLHSTQETRTLGESAINVGSSTILASLLGAGAMRLLSPAERRVAGESLDRARAELDANASGVRPAGPPEPTPPVSAAPPLIPEPGQTLVFHGSPTPFTEFADKGPYYFSTDHRAASNYAMASEAQTLATMRGEKPVLSGNQPHVVPAYLKMDKPFEATAADQNSVAHARDENWLRQNGYDSAILRDPADPSATEFIVLDRSQIRPKFAPPSAEVAPHPASVGAAAADTRELSPAPYGLESIPKAKEAIARMFPTMNALENGDAVTKGIVADLAEIPIRLRENIKGGTTTLEGGPAVDREVNMFRNGFNARAGDYMLGQWAEHRFGDSDIRAPRMRDAVQRAMGEPAPAGKLTFDEFDAAVYDALRTGDTHTIPQVAEAAQWMRRELYDPVSKRATAIEGFEPMTPRDGETYAPQNWNTELIRSRFDDYVNMWTDHLAAQQTKKAAAKERLTALNTELETARTNLAKAKDPDSAATFAARHDDVRAKIEAELAAWEGKSTGEAKSAIKAREKYAADTARADKIGTGPVDRLTSADKAVDSAVQSIIKSDRDLPRQELRARAQEIASRVISTPEGRLPYDMDLGGPQMGVPKTGSDLRGSAAHREIDLPYDVAAPWLDRSATRAAKSYLHSVWPDTVLAERFGGDPNMLVKFKEIEEAYAARAAGLSEAASKKLMAQRDTDMTIVAGLRDRTRGVFGYDPSARNFARMSQAALKINNIASSHMMAFSSLPDMAGAVFRHGFESGFGEAWSAYFRGLLDNEAWQALKKQGKELEAFGIGTETAIASRQHALQDINELYRPASRVERALSWASDKAFIVNLLAPLTDVQKRISANVAMNAILRASKAVAEGKATQKQLVMLGESNVKPHVAEKIWQHYSDNGGAQVKGVYLPNLADWPEGEAKLAFQAAVARDVDIAVVTPGQEKPFWMSRQGWNLLGQYHSFNISATQRILIANLQRMDAASLAGTVTAISMGMLSYRINTLYSGQPASTRPQDWFKEGISRGGVIGVLDDANTIASKMSRGGVDIYRLIGADKPLSRMAGRSAAEVLLGPTYGKIQNLTKITGSAASREWTASDTHAARMAILGSNLPFFPRAFEALEGAVNHGFNIPDMPPPKH